MRLLRVTLQDVRGVTNAEARFAPDGVTIVEAPNETGKSTLLEAVDVLLEVKDSSRSQRVKDLQPVDRDVSSTIEVELTCGAYHLTCTKTYHRQPATVLTIHAPTRESLRGAEAHDRLREILDAEVDPALYAALRYAQGRDLAAVPFGGSNVLAARLDAAAGGAGTADDGGLLERAFAEFQRWYTPTGRPGRALQAAAEELDEADAAHAALCARQDALQRDLDDLDRIDQQLPALRRRRAEELQSRLTAACAAQEQVHEARAALVAHRGEHLAAVRDQQAARRLVDQRTEQVERLARLHDEAAEAAAVIEPLRAQLLAAEAEHAGHASACQTATDATAQARRRCDEAQAVVDLLEARAERQRIAQRQERIAELTTRVRQAEAALATTQLDEAGLAAIRDADQAARAAEAAFAAGAPRLRLVAHRELEIAVDDDVVTLGAGGELERTVAGRLRIAVPALADLELEAGGSADDLRTAVDVARGRLREACAAAGVADLAEAVRVVAARAGHLADAERCTSELARELDGATPASLEAALEAVDRRIRGLEDRLDGSLPSAGDVEQAREAVAGARTEADAAADRLAAIRASHDTQLRELQALRTRVEIAGAGFAACRRHLEDVERQLAARRAEDGDDERLRSARTAAEQREQATATSLAATEQQLAALDPDAVERQVAAARAALARLDADVADLRAGQATLRERLRLSGEDGLGELVQQAADRLAQARLDHRRTTRRAAAARLLHEELTRARDEAYQAYRAPLCELITRDARIVFGADVEVEVDEDLCIVGRTLDGVTLPWDQLSAGAREQLAILAGLAAAQLAGGDGVPFVIDDALGYTDPTRLERLGEVLDRTSGAQVIVLTCVADRFRAVRGAHVVQLGDRTTATVTVPETPPPAADPDPVSPRSSAPSTVTAPSAPDPGAAPAGSEPTALPLPLPALAPQPTGATRPSEVARGRRRAKDGNAPPRQGRDRVRASDGEARERSGRPRDAEGQAETAALTLDLGPH